MTARPTEDNVIEKLKTVMDPELGIDVWSLGLVYKIVIDDEGIEILMTLTSAFCPFADELIKNVEDHVGELGYGDVRVEITFEPPWEPPEELRAALGV